MENSYLFKFYLYAYHSLDIDGMKREIHPHTWNIAIKIKTDKATGYSNIEEKIDKIIDKYRDRTLNEIEPFDKIEPSFENIGEVVYSEIENEFKDDIEIEMLEIAEGPIRSYCIKKDDELSERMKDIAVKACINGVIKNAEKSLYSSLYNKDEKKEKKEEYKEEEKKETTENEKEINEDEKKEQPKAIPKWQIAFSLITIIMLGIILFIYIERTGTCPWGSDSFGHIFKGDLMYKSIIQKGDFYPLYTKYWYNGVQPFRYWAPVPYYILAFFQWICGGNEITGYSIFIITVFIISAIGWLIWGIKEKRILLSLAMGILWFAMPDNIRVTFSEGNVPRIVMSAIFPYMLYFIWDFVERRNKKAIIMIIITMLIMCMTHLMIAAMFGVTAVIFLICYAIINKRASESILAIMGLLMAVPLCGIWLYPALQGGIMGLDVDAVAEVMQKLTFPATESLSPLIRFSDREHYYFGIVILVSAIGGAILANKKSLPAFLTVIIIFMGTTKFFVPVFAKLPLNQLLWMMRFTPAAYGFYIIGCLAWKHIKKVPIILLTGLLIWDCGTSFYLLAYNTEPRDEMKEMLDEIIEETDTRTAILDCSELGSFPSYYLSSGDKKVEYMYGWAWQGAKTAENIVNVNTALEAGNYGYMFDRCLESGCDTVMVAKHKVERLDLLKYYAKKSKYNMIWENDIGYLFKRNLPKNFGIKTEYKGLAIGKTASMLVYDFPCFEIAQEAYIDKYDIDKLCEYEVIYLSEFKYSDKKRAEEIIKKVSERGTRIVIDMNRVPTDPLTNRMTFMEVTAQAIKFENKLPDLHFKDITYFPITFKEENRNWNTIYLENVYNETGFSWFGNNKIAFMGTDKSGKITFLGFNLLYHGIVNNDESIKEMFAEAIGENIRELPKREINEIEIQKIDNKIYIKTPIKGVNTSLAYIDEFNTEAKTGKIHNFLIAEENDTEIEIKYPYIYKGFMVSGIGIIISIIFIILVIKKKE